MVFMNSYYPTSVLDVPNATPETKDAAQYMFRKGTKQYNLCGEFCVSYCVGERNINDFLDRWEADDLKWYQQVFRGGAGRTTGIYDLEKMLNVYGISTPCERFTAYNLGFTSAKLDDYHAIVGVQIDSKGYLVGKGIAHWIVLLRIDVVDDNHAICTVYNPYTNNIEPYTWRELMTSTGAYKQGIWVRKV